MNIAMLSELFYPYMVGGAERRYYEIAKRLAKDHEVTVYALRLHGQRSSEIVENVRIERVGFAHPINKRSFPHLMAFFPAFFRGLQSKYDLIDANQGIASFSGFSRCLTKKPLLATFHDIYWNTWGEHFRFPFSSFGKFMEFAWSKARYTQIIANSPETAEKLQHLGFRAPIETISSGVDLDFINKIKANHDKKTITYVGRLENYKHVDTLMTAVASLKKKIPDLRLNIIGSGSEEFNLKDLARSYKLDVNFFGFVDERKKIEIMKSSSVIVNPSTIEGLGLIALESMACGVPVIVRDLRCYFFCNGKNAEKYNDDRELSSVLYNVLTKPALRNALIKNGTRTAKEFSWDETAKKVEKIYEKCLK